jgi:hypothetical protein
MLERWRAAPAEGVHSDEVWHAVAYPKFENAEIVASAAVILVILHLAPSPVVCTDAPRRRNVRLCAAFLGNAAAHLALTKLQLQGTKPMRDKVRAQPNPCAMGFKASAYFTRETSAEDSLVDPICIGGPAFAQLQLTFLHCTSERRGTLFECSPHLFSST